MRSSVYRRASANERCPSAASGLPMTFVGRAIADALAGSRPSVPIDRTFEELLTHEVMTSERRRMLSLAGLLTAIFAFILLLIVLAPVSILAAIFRSGVPTHVPFIVFPPFILYELAAAGVVTFLDRRGRRLPTIGRYVNATIETSFPTLLLYLLAGYLSAPVKAESAKLSRKVERMMKRK